MAPNFVHHFSAAAKSITQSEPLSLRLKHRQRKLLIPGLLGGVVLFVTWVSYSSYRTARALFLEKLEATALQQVQQSGYQLDHWLLARKKETLTLANTPTLRSMDWDQAGPFLIPELERLSDFYYLSMINPDGSYYSTEGGWAKGKNLKDRKHVQASMAGRTYASDPVRSRTLGGLTIVAVTAPIWPDPDAVESPTGQPKGVLAGLIDIERLVTITEGLEYGPDSYAFALNSEGLAIAHPDPTLMSTINDENPVRLTDESQGELATIAQRMVKRESDIQLIQRSGESVYVAFLPLEEADWSIALVIPQQNIASQLRLLDLLTCLVVSLAMALLLLLWRIQHSEQRRLRESKALADSANQAKSEFLSNMSHELRTPLNAILGFSQLMQSDSSLATSHRDHLTVINRSGEHLLQLIDDILTMSKIEAGRIILSCNDFSLYGFLDELRSMLRLKAHEKGVQLLFETDKDLPLYINTDESKLRQILINLLNNALKFTESGYVKLRVTLQEPEADASEPLQSMAGETLVPEPAQVLEPAHPLVAGSDGAEVNNPAASNPEANNSEAHHPAAHHPAALETSACDAPAQSHRTLRFSVIDSGPGIRTDELPNLFIPFVQTETGRRSQQGTGLGLPISRKFSRLMGGDITVMSELGKGSTFHCDISAGIAQSALRADQQNRQVVGLQANQPAYRMVVAEDNADNRRLLSHLLREAGFDVQEAKNGKEALHLCHESPPHMLWMDLRMPEMNGLMAARAITTAPQTSLLGQNPPILVAVTANAFDSDRAQALEAGFDDFVAKPYKRQIIFEKIAEHLSVQYRYADELDAATVSVNQHRYYALSADALSGLPSQWHRDLKTAILQLDSPTIESIVDEVPLPELRRALQELTQDFCYETLLELLQDEDESATVATMPSDAID